MCFSLCMLLTLLRVSAIWRYWIYTLWHAYAGILVVTSQHNDLIYCEEGTILFSIESSPPLYFHLFKIHYTGGYLLMLTLGFTIHHLFLVFGFKLSLIYDSVLKNPFNFYLFLWVFMPICEHMDFARDNCVTQQYLVA